MTKGLSDLTRRIRRCVRSCPSCRRMIAVRWDSVVQAGGRTTFTVYGCPCGPQTYTWGVGAMTELSRPAGGPLLEDQAA